MARKFGRSFEPLDLLPIASLNYREIGKVKVDCQFRQSKSLWGVLGEDEQPAGILYIDLKFDQPKSCRLSSATVVVTLEEVDISEDSDDDDDESTGAKFSSNLVQVLDRYGPKQLSGEQKTMPVKKTYHDTPHLDILGNGGGGLGVDIEKTRTYASRWTFRGDLLPGKDKRRKGARGTVYKSIKWELSENDIDTQTVHSNVIRTGFAFQHEAQPCYLRVEIEGKLQRTRDRIKNKFKFPPEHRKDQGSTLTVMNLSRSDEFKKRLDHIADGLSRAMELENYTEIPIEVPDALPASFQEAPPANSSNEPAINSTLTAPATFLQSAPANISNQAPGRIASAQSQVYLDAFVNASDPLIERLAKALDPIHAPEVQRHIPPSTQSVAPSDHSTTTLVEENSARGEEVVDSSREIRKGLEAEAAQETFLRLSQSPALLLLIHLLASFLDLFGRASNSSKSVPSDKRPHVL
jgi:hypothetical protein